jgi:hypothetical protein
VDPDILLRKEKVTVRSLCLWSCGLAFDDGDGSGRTQGWFGLEHRVGSAGTLKDKGFRCINNGYKYLSV